MKGRDIWHTFWNAAEEPLRFLEIIAPSEFSEFFEEIAPLMPLDPTDEEGVSQFLTIGERYGFEADLESIPTLCEQYELQI